jgi:hypothetical protein
MQVLHEMVKNMPNPASYVQPIHFEDFDGSQFERLVFAYHWRSENWRSLEWYGQVGSRHCQCDKPNCATYFFNPSEAADDLERLRHEALTSELSAKCA